MRFAFFETWLCGRSRNADRLNLFDAATQRQFLEIIHRQSQRIGALVADLLTLSELQAKPNEEVVRETWRQLKRSINAERELLRDEDLHSWFLDPDIEIDPARPGYLRNVEPLLVN